MSSQNSLPNEVTSINDENNANAANNEFVTINLQSNHDEKATNRIQNG